MEVAALSPLASPAGAAIVVVLFTPADEVGS
jgi:hypothetical protein